MGHSSSHIVVVGPMAVGKSTIGTLLAADLGLPFLDSDATLQARTGEDGAVIAKREGVSALHDLELESFLEMCREDRRSVIAAAASVVDFPPGQRALAENLTIWLTAPESVLAARQDGDDHRRELAAVERMTLSMRREPLLHEVAALRVDTGSRSVAEIVEQLVERVTEIQGDQGVTDP